MSVSEKLTAVAANMQRVYEAGLANGSYDNGYADGQTAGYNSGHADGVQAGKQAEQDAFWDMYQQNGQRTSYQYAFSYVWDEKSFRPKYDMVPTNVSYIFANAEITDLVGLLEDRGVTMDFSKCTIFNWMTVGSKITRFPTIDLSSATNFNDGFRQHGTLVEAKLIGVRDVVQWSNSFHFCSALTTLTIEGIIGKAFSVSSSNKLTHDSLMSVISALKDLTPSGTTLTCTLGATNLAKLTDTEKAIATDKGWTLA